MNRVVKLFYSKKFWIIILILVLIVGGLFYWQKDRIRNFLRERRLAKIRAPAEDYSVVYDSGKHFIVNEKDEFKLKVPGKWQVSLGTQSGGIVSDFRSILYSNDFHYRKPKGCLVEFYISRLAKSRSKEIPGGTRFYLIENAQKVKKKIEYYKNNQEKGKRIILVDQKEAFWEKNLLDNNSGSRITVEIPYQGRVYKLVLVSFSKKCNEQLKYILNSLSIGDITL